MKNAVIIGASSGIGRETARLLARSGRYDRVGITARRLEMLEETASVAPQRFIASDFDLAAADAIDRLSDLLDQVGDVSLIVLCSGTGHINEKLDIGPECETNTLNVDAFTRVSVFCYNYLKARGEGIFAAVTSVMGLRGSRSAPAYAASKAYQINYLEGLRQKARREKSGVSVVDIRPGSVETDMMKGEGHFWITSPEKAARLIVKGMKKRKKVIYVSRRWCLIGSLLKSLPRGLYEKM